MSTNGQSRTMSLVESTTSVTLGYVLTVLIQYYLYPVFGISIPVQDALIISVLIVLIAFVKNFGVRRLFNHIHVNTTSLGFTGQPTASGEPALKPGKIGSG